MAIELINSKTRTMNAPAAQLMLIASMHTQGRYFDCGYTLRGISESLIEARVWNGFGRNFSESETKQIEALAEDFGTAVETKADELGIVIYEQENLKSTSPLEPTEMLRQFNFVLREFAKDLCTEVKIIACQPDLEDAGRLNSNKLAVTSIVLIEFDDHKFVAPMTNSWVYGNYESVPQEYKDRILISYNEGLTPVDEAHSDLYDIYQSINSYVMQTLDLICRHTAVELTKKQ
ncbi:hypothetical protein [uncultured Psychrobacter sp.]|uniref:hypothetical protein n=1 Tax=uncultured Psychrobacter sp. TaxID=259303 RepID=UPI0030DCDD6F